METRIINGVKYKMLKRGDIIRNGDRLSCGHMLRITVGRKNTTLLNTDDVWRPIPLSPKKAKRKAKKQEAWAFMGKKTGLVALHTIKATKSWGYRPNSDDEIVRVEIRPLVTRKKGK